MGSQKNQKKKRGGKPQQPASSKAPSSTVHSSDTSGNPVASESVDSNPDPQVKESGNADMPSTNVEKQEEGQPSKQGEVHLYPVNVKTQTGEKLQLQLSPGDSVMDVRQLLLEVKETCFYTCYDLLLHTNDGSAHRLEDHNEISDVADISTCDCQLEMVAAYYDDRSIRAHLLRTRELLSLSTMHSSASKSLELQNETGRDTSANIGLDPSKIEVTELDKLRDLKETSSLLPDLFVRPRQEIQLVQSMEFSSFNPPPSYRRLSGNLIYLDVVTLEGKKYCITGTTKAFYVNSSTGILLDPKPMKSFSDSPTLVGLLQKLSSTFKQAFQDILARRASAHPFENVQSLLPPNSWLGVHPVPGHKRDAARAENVVTLTFGSELIGMQRDWNEELQSCREFPHSLSHQRILRDRALYKVTTDFVDAAVNGAVGVINRCIPPINPTDPECFHMYVHNNIFFSFAFDADTDKSLRGHESDSVSDTKIADVPQNSGEKDGATERQLADNEQATYASANNDLKGTKAYQEADIDGLYNLAMVIVDYRGHRVIAQSVLPGILQGDKSESLLYGSVDNGKKISWNEDFHSKVAEAAKRLHLKEHTVLDASGNAFRLAAPVECKGIVGSDDRHYLLDLMRVTPRDANYTEPGSRYCILRPELITAFCRAKAAEKLKAQSKSDIDSEAVVTSEDGATQSDSEGQITSDTGAVVEVCDSGSESKHATEDILFNPNVFAEVRLAGSPEEIAADEEDVRKASCYLKDVVLPKFISDLCTLEVSPMDGQTLTEALHANGINVRYIGKVAVDTGDFPHLRELCTNEIIVRSAKHILKDVLRETEDHDLGNAITHFFNCLFGNVASPGNSKSQKKTLQDGTSRVDSWKFAKNQGKTKKRASSVKNQSLYSSISSDGLWSDIQEFAKLKYQFQLHDNARLDAKKIPVIRNLCQKVGISIAARTYDLSEAAPFRGPDILDLQPVVKHAIPFSSAARDLVERGKVHLAEGMLSEAYGTFSEAFTILQQVTGPMHREVANCCRYLAMVLYHAGDMGGAINQQQKELIINERCLGLDHPDTAHSYGNMALFYHGLNNTELALRHMARALLLLCLSSGPNHPDIAATFINVAMMYQDIGNLSKALQFLNEAKNKNEKLLGKEHIQTAVCHHALAILYNCMPNYTLSVQNEKKTYDILVKKLGEDDPRSRDSLNWINTFNKRMAQAQQSSTEAHGILQAHPELIQALQAAAGAGSVANSNGSVNKSLNASILGEPLPRGRGVDERAARAAAEARKKAAARGLAVRPQGGPAQALPPLTRLINIINSGMTTETVNGEGNNSNKGAENGHASGVNGSASVKESKKGQQQQTPIGLGAGLQQKTKPKGK